MTFLGLSDLVKNYLSWRYIPFTYSVLHLCTCLYLGHEQHREGTADGQNPVLAAKNVDASFSSVDPFGLSIHFFPGAIGQSREKGLSIRQLSVGANISCDRLLILVPVVGTPLISLSSLMHFLLHPIDISIHPYLTFYGMRFLYPFLSA